MSESTLTIEVYQQGALGTVLAVTPGDADGHVVTVLGYAAELDGGEGFAWWDADSTAPADNIDIWGSGTGRWIRLPIGAGTPGITALTGDVTATGPGSVAATIANGSVTTAKLHASVQAALVDERTPLDDSVTAAKIDATDAPAIRAVLDLDSAYTASVDSGITVQPADHQLINIVALTDITGLSFPVVAGHMYQFEFQIKYSVTNVNFGAMFTANGPAFAAGDLAISIEYTNAVTSRAVQNGIATWDTVTGVSASSSLDSNIVIVRGFVTPTASDDVVGRFRCESNITDLTAKKGSFVTWRKLT